MEWIKMINVKQIPEFNKALPLIETIEDAGYEAYFVGGGVRDTLLNQPSCHKPACCMCKNPAVIQAAEPSFPKRSVS